MSTFTGQDPHHRGATIIGILDADAYVSDGALDYLVGPQRFSDLAVGAAKLKMWMKNQDDQRPRPELGWLGNRLAWWTNKCSGSAR